MNRTEILQVCVFFACLTALTFAGLFAVAVAS